MRSWARIILQTCLATGVFHPGGVIANELGHANGQIVPEGTLPDDPSVDAIGQLPDGRMLFGAHQGVFIYDGATTEFIAFPQSQISVRQVESTSDGDILIAATNLMAIARDRGHWELESFPTDNTRSTAWLEPYKIILEGAEPIAINSTTSGWSQQGKWTSWPTLKRDKAQYIRVGPSSLLKFTETGRIERWVRPQWQLDRKLSEQIEGVITLAEAGPDQTLRLIMDDGRVLDIDAGGTVQTVALLSDPTTPLRLAKSIPHGGYVVVSADSMVSVLNADLSLAAQISPGHGLPVGAVEDVFVDRQSDIWCAVSGQLTRLELPQAVTRFDRFNGLDTPAVHALVRHDGALYAATNGGVYRLEPGQSPDAPARFQLLRGPRNLTPVLLEHAGRLFAGSADGIYIWENGAFELLTRTAGQVLCLTPSPCDPDVIYYGMTGGSGLLQRGPNGWSAPADTVNSSNGVTGIFQSGPTEWWVTFPQSVARYHATPAGSSGAPDPNIQFQLKLKLFGQWTAYHSFPKLNAWLAGDRAPRLQSWGKQQLIVSTHGLREASGNTEVLDPVTQDDLDRDRRLRAFAAVDADHAWIALGPTGNARKSGLGWQLRQIGRNAEKPARILPAVAAQVGAIHVLLPESGPSGPVLWVGGEDGLLRLNLDRLPAPLAPAKPRVTLKGELVDHAIERPLPHDHTQLGFGFASPDFSSAGPITYRSRLVSGGRGEWTDFSPLPGHDFGHLGPGHYRIEVQARNADGLVSPVRELSFTVATPWWLSWPGALLAGVTAIGLIVFGMQWASRRGRAREQQLETLVAERTVTLRANERQLSEAKNQAETARAQAEQANRAKSTFLAAMSHELRTPLNAILGYAQILRREDGLSTKGQNQLTVIDRNGKHLLEMINEVLDLSKIEADKMTLHPVAFSLRRMAADLAETFQLRASERGLSFRLEFGPGVPSRVIADAPKLRQVLINLLANALEHTTKGEVVLALGSHADRVRFAVKDTGKGIAAAELENIFEPFRQARLNESAGADAKGSGLGLPISRRLVGLMGGQIKVESTVGAGSCFHFELALPSARDDMDSAAPFRITGYAGPRRRILVVDDVATNRDVLRELLAVLGFEVIEAADGETALACFARTPADLVLLDLHLPGMSGAKVAAALRQTKPRPRLIAISASVFDMDQDSAARAGCDAFVVKPIEESGLLAHIAEQLRLQWITAPLTPRAESAAADQSSGMTTADLLRLELPAATELEAWLELARRSDQRKLRAALAACDPMAPGADFRREIDRLAARFRTGTIREILTAALQTSRPAAHES